jgi:hypothetical protein
LADKSKLIGFIAETLDMGISNLTLFLVYLPGHIFQFFVVENAVLILLELYLEFEYL